jgi:hypothetical protein
LSRCMAIFRMDYRLSTWKIVDYLIYCDAAIKCGAAGGTLSVAHADRKFNHG